MARNFRQQEDEFGKQMAAIIEQVFTDEDGAMIAEIQKNMGDQSDLMALRPVVLPTDKAAIRTRLIMKRLLKQEEVGAPDPLATAGA
jgi:vanillate O-demethylase monooxygenase subunit